MRIIFMGSPGFAVPSLDALVNAGHDIVAAYTQPPRRAGRGKGEQPTAVHQRASELGIEVRTPASLRSAEEQQAFARLEADLAVVAAYGLILPRPILEAPARGCVNVHASLLPRWRGAAPIQRAILAGDKTSGVTIMAMDEGLDTGDILLKRELPIEGKTGGELTEELALIGASALIDWLSDPGPGEPQPDAGATYAAKITKSEARIDWTNDVEAICRQVRAFQPAPGAWFEARGERIRLVEASQAEGIGHPGEVLDDHLTIACGNGAIEAVRVQRAGRGVMTAAELLRGFPIEEGSILR